MYYPVPCFFPFLCFGDWYQHIQCNSFHQLIILFYGYNVIIYVYWSNERTLRWFSLVHALTQYCSKCPLRVSLYTTPCHMEAELPGPPRSSQGCFLRVRPLARSKVFLKREKLPAVIAGSWPVLAPLSRSRDRATCPLVTTPVHHCTTSDVQVAFPGIS